MKDTIKAFVNPGAFLVALMLVILFYTSRTAQQTNLRNQVYSRFNSCALSRVLIISNTEREARRQAVQECWTQVQSDIGVQVKQYNDKEYTKWLIQQ